MFILKCRKEAPSSQTHNFFLLLKNNMITYKSSKNKDLKNDEDKESLPDLLNYCPR